MKTTLKGILIGIVLLASAGQAFAYPPDNAAVLYYKAFMLMKEPNDADENLLRQLRKVISGLMNKSDFALKITVKPSRRLLTAAQIKNCDWGLDYSEGLAMLLPHLGKCRIVCVLARCRWKAFAEKGDYKTALERCMALCEMNGHTSWRRYR